MAEYSAQIAKLLDQAARLAPYTGTRWHDAHLRLDEAEQLVMLASVEPNYKRGQKTITGAKSGHEIVHGTEREKQERWREYREAAEQMHQRNPALSWTEIERRVGEYFQVSAKSIYRARKKS